jgi:hypothetical protein
MAIRQADDYYIHLSPLKAPPAAAARAQHAGTDQEEIPLAAGSARPMHRIRAVLFVLAGIALGFGIPFLLYVFLGIGFWGSTKSDPRFFIGLGIFIAACGIAGGIVMWLPWRTRPALLFDEDAVCVRYPGFARPLVVPRALIRLVSIDDRPVHYFHRNDRFPVEGDVPESSFVDALDVHPSNPWEPHAPESRRPGFPIPSALEKPDGTYLFSADRSALPVLRVNPEDVPNVAVLFHESIPTPRAPVGMLLFGECSGLLGGRRIHGMLLRVRDAARAGEAFGRWGIVRPVTAEDVIEEHLLLPKPLKGIRAVVYGALLIVPVVLRIVLRHHF